MKTEPRWLLLGGTQEAKVLALKLHDLGVDIIYSIAGLVRKPILPCEINIGGFSARGGLAAFIRHHSITGIVNATHPYASKMTETAAVTAQQLEIPYWRYLRPAWQPTQQDQWSNFADWSSLLNALAVKRNIFFTTGQPATEVESFLSQLNPQSQQNAITRKAIVRTALAGKPFDRSDVLWLQGIGPFSIAEEIALMERCEVDALVTKNSGGDFTSAKLIAARQLNIPVFILARPKQPTVGQTETSLEKIIDELCKTVRPISLQGTSSE